MALHLHTTLSLISAVPAVIAIAQGKDGATRAWCGALLAVTLAIGLRPYVGFIAQYVNDHAVMGLCVAAGVLSVICAVRAGNAVLSTLMVTGSVLLALLSLRIVA